jgi:DNA-directed RNA polymerase subunit H (RpoH/RPB5)
MSANNPIILNKDFDTIKNTVLENIVKMISYRGWINKSKINKIVEDLSSIDNDEYTYSVNLDVDLKTFDYIDFTESLIEDKDGNISLSSNKEEKSKKKNLAVGTAFEGTKVYIKLLPQQKITSIEKSTSLNDFINKYVKYHRIVVVDSITDKPLTKINNMDNIEVFPEADLMINLVDHVASPQYQVLRDNQIDQFKNDYKISTLHYLPIMYDTDRASKYLYVKKGQIVRIIRNTKNTETSIGYRVIAKKGNAKI